MPSETGAVGSSVNDPGLPRAFWGQYWQFQADDRWLKVEIALELHGSGECVHDPSILHLLLSTRQRQSDMNIAMTSLQRLYEVRPRPELGR